MNVNVFTAAARSGRGLTASPRHSTRRLDFRGTVSASAAAGTYFLFAAGDVMNA